MGTRVPGGGVQDIANPTASEMREVERAMIEPQRPWRGCGLGCHACPVFAGDGSVLAGDEVPWP